MILETKRLLLRPFYESDAEDVYAYARDPRVGPVAGWPAHKIVEDSRQAIRTVFAGPRVFAMTKKDTGKVIGSIGLVDRHFGDPPLPDNELGYALGADYWGQGLTTEAARTVIAYCFTQLGLQTLWCGYYEGNDHSRRVMEKCGFTYRFSRWEDVELMHERRKSHYYALTRSQWEAGRPE